MGSREGVRELIDHIPKAVATVIATPAPSMAPAKGNSVGKIGSNAAPGDEMGWAAVEGRATLTSHHIETGGPYLHVGQRGHGKRQS